MPKVLLLLVPVVFLMGRVRSFFCPGRTRALASAPGVVAHAGGLPKPEDVAHRMAGRGHARAASTAPPPGGVSPWRPGRAA
ncbi:hypothetical protein [Teichococcus aestuarii]|uniref:hypothetical protein n=1 Tax=Teichococcus aestuarii TaxID=568898 RepID=UPI00361B3B66